jgi:hypothetical protein
MYVVLGISSGKQRIVGTCTVERYHAVERGEWAEITLPSEENGLLLTQFCRFRLGEINASVDEERV